MPVGAIRPPYIDRAIADGHAEIVGDGRSQRICYVAVGHMERYADPEEQVRAELWAELIYKYEYSPERLQFEVNVPRRTPNDFADLVIYKDDHQKSPFIVFECKRPENIRRRIQPVHHATGYQPSQVRVEAGDEESRLKRRVGGAVSCASTRSTGCASASSTPTHQSPLHARVTPHHWSRRRVVQTPTTTPTREPQR